MKLSPEGLAMLQHFEGTVTHVYRDQVGIETVCTGHVVQPDDASWIADGVTRAECAAVLAEDVDRYARCVDEFVTVALTQNQFDALASLCFNIGETAFRKSTLVRLLNEGDYTGAAAHFTDWRFAGGKPILFNRREHERLVFLGDGNSTMFTPEYTAELNARIMASLTASVDPAPRRDDPA